MTIRKKLVLSFILVLILPYIFARLFYSYGFDFFFEDDSYLKHQLKASFWDVSYMTSSLHRDFNLQINENPDIYLERDVFEGEKIPHDLVGFIVLKDNKIVNKSKLFENYSLEDMEKIYLNWGEEFNPKYSINMDSELYPMLVQDFKFSDGSPGSIQIYVSKEYYEQHFANIYKYIGVAIMIAVGGVLMIVSYLIARGINRKLKNLEMAAARISNGDFATEVKYDGKDEFKNLYDTFENMRVKLYTYREMGFKMASEREKMITSVSHDIRTPVTAIKGYVQGIRDGVASSDEKRDEYLRIIYEKTVDIEDMIKDLREISTLEMTKNNYNYQKININDFIRDFSEEMSFDIENINGKVISEFISEATYVMVDPVKLRRVFMNIYENSKKYRSEKDLIIRVNEYKENDYVMIDITDNGIGIKAKDTKLVFDRFFRGDRSRNTDIPGSGLGLSICKEIMDNHEGGISIRSKKKEGTTVTVSLRIWDGE